MDSCCQGDENAHDALRRNVFVWTLVAVCMWCSLPVGAFETVQWWTARTPSTVTLVGVTLAAAYFWGRLLRERRKAHHHA